MSTYMCCGGVTFACIISPKSVYPRLLSPSSSVSTILSFLSIRVRRPATDLSVGFRPSRDHLIVLILCASSMSLVWHLFGQSLKCPHSSQRTDWGILICCALLCACTQVRRISIASLAYVCTSWMFTNLLRLACSS